MRHLLFLLLVSFASCYSGQSYMTRQRFDEIPVGSTLAQVKQVAGEPMEITHLNSGAEEYLYVEKIQMASEVAAENHYILVISGGRVISKRFEMENPPAFDLIYQNDPNFTGP